MNEDELVMVVEIAYNMFSDGTGLSDVAEAIRDRFEMTPSEVARTLSECGFEAEDVARALYRGLHLSRREVALALVSGSLLTAAEADSAMRTL